MLIRFGNEKQLSQFGLECNTSEVGLFSNVSAACARGLAQVEYVPEVKQPAIVCGSGPSLADTLEDIRRLKAAGGKVFALNNAARFLSENGIHPDAQILVDPRVENVRFLEKAWADEALLCSQCAPELFDQCASVGYPVRLWHPLIQGIEEHIPTKNPLLICSNLTVGLSSLSLIWTMGHREIHLFGYDSSHKEDKSHAFAQPMNDGDELVRCCVDSRIFNCSIAMAGQANSFKGTYEMLESNGMKFHVYGDGLIPHLFRSWEKAKALKVLTAVYDLGVSPPSYDFLSFLAEAERYRRHAGYGLIDIVFQPGPMRGFRDDELPPDIPTRQNMLWSVCVAMTKLLPSVRNIEVLTHRMAVAGDVFPTQWKEDAPVSHYGTSYLHDAEPLLKASDYARKQVQLRFSKPYATITMREAKHWGPRNSNRDAWVTVANWLIDNNIQPVFIPDTEGAGFDGRFAEFQAASFNLDLRAALYEGAIVNMGVLNGPMSVAAFLDSRYLIFNVGGGDEMAAGSDSFMKAHGFGRGDQLGGNGKLIWEKDTAGVILRELQEFKVKTTEIVK